MIPLPAGSLKLPNEPARFYGQDFNNLLLFACDSSVSDVTIQSDECVYFEIHGEQCQVTNRKLTNHELEELTNFIYGPNGTARIKQGEDIDMSYEIRRSRNQRHRFRINVTGCQSNGGDGIQVTIRTIKSKPSHISELGVDDRIISACQPRDGLVVVAGPTGSGKSTLLSSIIRMIIENPDSSKKVITYESPIEYVYDEISHPTCPVSQHEIPRHLPSFGRAVRNSLRRAPKIILVGESRDRETIEAAIEASETGHALYTTVHSNSVAETLYRMVNAFHPAERSSKMYELIESLRLIVVQRLIRSTSGGRVAVREFLEFNQSVRDSLRTTQTLKEAVSMTASLVEKNGLSMLGSALLLLDSGRIDERECSMFETRSKAAVQIDDFDGVF